MCIRITRELVQNVKFHLCAQIVQLSTSGVGSKIIVFTNTKGDSTRRSEDHTLRKTLLYKVIIAEKGVGGTLRVP